MIGYFLTNQFFYLLIDNNRMSWVLSKLSLTPTSSPVTSRKNSLAELIIDDQTDHKIPTEEDYEKFINEVTQTDKSWSSSYSSNNLNIWTQP